MSDTDSQLTGRAAELRLAFDRSFAEQQRFDAALQEDFLAIRLGADNYAIHLSEIAGLYADKHVTRVPSRFAALIGIAGFRGTIMPVYDLQVLLGLPAVEKPSWLAVASGAPVAFAFEAFDSHLRISNNEIVSYDPNEPSRKYVREFVNAGGIARPIVHLPSILDAIKNEISKGKTVREG